MGIDITSFEGFLLAQKYCKKTSTALTLGRQGIHINKEIFDIILQKYQYNFKDAHDIYCEKLLHNLGFTHIDSIDNSAYEQCTIVHNMNKPVDKTLYNKYNFIYDGGTIEHIFNIAQVMDNIINMLDINGIFCSVTCNNNFSGHGMYQFSPEFFLSTLNTKYGMEIISLYIAKVNTVSTHWIDVNNYGNGRNVTKFNSLEPVYIITIARKISDERVSVISDPPNQYSYEKQEW